MKHINSKDIEGILFDDIVPMLEKLKNKTTGLEYLETILYYLFNAADKINKDETIIRLNNELKNEKIKDKIMTIAEQLRQEGMEKGIEKGMEIGEKKGEAKTVFKQLTLKFQDKAEEYRDMVFNASLEDLDKMVERILTVKKIEDVFK